MFIALALILLCVYAVVKLVGRPSRFSPDHIQAELEGTALRYFLDNANPKTGLVRDNSLNFAPNPAWNRMASMAATGFGLAVIANAATRGMLDPAFATNYTRQTLKFAIQHVPRRKGWFMHFIDWETGNRWGGSEYASVDTALFLAGGMYAAEALHDNESQHLCEQIYADLDFEDFRTQGGAHPEKRTLTMAYFPESGYTANEWNMFAEQMLLLVMGLGHPTHPMAPEAWRAWRRPMSTLPDGQQVMGWDTALFVHQYSQLFIDFRQFHDGFVNYHENAATVSQAQRAMVDPDSKYKSLAAGFWGFSNGSGPNDGYISSTPVNHGDLVCFSCALGSAMYMPDQILMDASHWARSPYRKSIWGKYGFTDSLDLSAGWFSDHVYGITVGPLFLSFANARPETSIWKHFMKIPAIQLGLERAANSQVPSTDKGSKSALTEK